MKTLKIKLPTSWDTLTDVQLQELALLFHTVEVGAAFHIRVFLILMGCRWYTWRKNYRAMRILKEVPISELRQHYPFVYKENNRTLFPAIKGRAPYRALANITAEEFAAAEDLHAIWFKEKHRNALQYLAAVLYPGKGETFDRFELDARAKRFAKTPLKTLLAIEAAYFGSKNAIVKRFKHAFKPSGKKVSGPKQGFGKVILEMAGGKFGAHNITLKTNIYTFLEEFNDNLNPLNKKQTRRP